MYYHTQQIKDNKKIPVSNNWYFENKSTNFELV
jgi:hypothetical protein